MKALKKPLVIFIYDKANLILCSDATCQALDHNSLI